MGRGINFYKDVKLVKHEEKDVFGDYDWNELKYIDNHSISWSYGNTYRLGLLFEKYTNLSLPIILCEDDNDCLEDLIKPEDMVKYCDKVLNNATGEELEEWGNRVEYIKEISEKGYYVSYDCD